MNIFKKTAIAIAAVSLIVLSGGAGADTHHSSMSMQEKIDGTVLIRTASVKTTNELKKMKKPPKNMPPILANGATLDGYGSGWFRQGTDKIVTAAHVIDSEDVIQVQLSDGRKFDATVVYENKESDIAEIQLVNPNSAPLPTGFQVCSTSPNFGDHVMIVGYPLGISLMVHQGTVANPDVNHVISDEDIGQKTKIDAMSVDMELEPGFSGGPLITDDNCVAGIGDFTLYEQQEEQGPYASLNFSVTTNNLNKFISQADDPSLRPVVKQDAPVLTSSKNTPPAPTK